MRTVKFLSTLLIILTITGSQFVTTLASQFISLEDASQIVTVPYRAFVLLIACLLIMFTYKKNVKINKVNNLLWLFWGFIIIRFVYDMYFRLDVSVESSRINQLWLLMICSTLIPMYAIMKSYQYVDKKWLFYGTYLLSIITAILIINSVEGYLEADEVEEERLESNAVMGSIQTGYFGLLVLILSVFSFVRSHKIWMKLLNAVIIGIGIILLFRSGSRGPIFSVIGITLFYFLSMRRNPIFTLLSTVGFCLVFVYWDYIILLVSGFAPNLYIRFTGEEVLLGDRLPFYSAAWQSFLKNPFWGHDFAIYGGGVGGMAYAHNMFLDALMQLGIIGFFILLYIVFKILKLIIHNFSNGKVLIWLNMFLLMKFFMLQLSSTFYIESSISIIMMYLFQLQISENSNKSFYISTNYAREN
jgi:O-antigen ligase